jgi:hypothetical protein
MTIRYVSLRSDSGEDRWYLSTGIYQRYDKAGSLVDEHPFSVNDNTWAAAIQGLDSMDGADLLTKLRTALTTNKTYLDKVNAGTATNTDHSAQVAALTRQTTAVLLRLMLSTG